MKRLNERRRRAAIAIAGFAPLAVAVAVGTIGSLGAGSAAAQTRDEFNGTTLRGAGSSFAQPLLARWAQDYQHWRSGGIAIVGAGSGLDGDIGDPMLDYEPVGSQAGIERLKTGAVDFAVSELPLSADELKHSKLLQVPMITGAVAVTYHLPGGEAAPLRLSGSVLADIFSGRIQRWSDPAIAASNSELTLPDQPIAVVHRADGSGTTWTFTNWLARASENWSRHIGAGLTVAWPGGEGVRGSSAVVDTVLRTPYSISYVNLVEARSRGASVATIATRDGQWVVPAAESVRSAVTTLADRKDPSALLLDAPAPGAYPIVATVYGLAADDRRRRATRAQQFLGWALSQGIARAEALGYVALPAAVAEQARQVLGD